MKENNNVKVKVKKKTKQTQLVPVVITIATLSVFVLVLNTNFSGLMGNSVANYYCKDSSYELNGNVCESNIISTPLLLGDIDLDGEITNNDVDLLKKYVSKKVELDDIKLLVADVDQNKVVNNKDVVKLEKYLKGSYSKEYVCQKGFTYKDKNVCIKTLKVKALRK